MEGTSNTASVSTPITPSAETREKLIGIRKAFIEANQLLHQASDLLEENKDTTFFHQIVAVNAKLVELDDEIRSKIDDGQY